MMSASDEFALHESRYPPASHIAEDWMPEFSKIAKSSKRLPVLPSFARSIDAWFRAGASSKAALPTIKGIVWKKDEGKALLSALGFPVPETIIERVASSDINFDLLRGRDVMIKPLNATDSYGIIPLYASGSFWKTGRNSDVVEEVEIRSRMRHLMHRLSEDAWIVEELLKPKSDRFDTIADTKFYTFYGVTPLILQKENDPEPTYRWFDRKLNPVDIVKGRQKPSHTASPPADIEEMQELANAVSRSLPFPFIRVDLYSTSRGPVCGELTVTPGNYYSFPSHIDHLLGCYYEGAQSRLLRDIWRGAQNFEPIKAAFPDMLPF